MATMKRIEVNLRRDTRCPLTGKQEDIAVVETNGVVYVYTTEIGMYRIAEVYQSEVIHKGYGRTTKELPWYVALVFGD